jgi:tRNA(Phe) wybutosine-synthesizing methylase Tyw3
MSDNCLQQLPCIRKTYNKLPLSNYLKTHKIQIWAISIVNEKARKQYINFYQTEILHINTKNLNFAKEIFTLVHICNGGIYIICHNHFSTTISNPILYNPTTSSKANFMFQNTINRVAPFM